MKVTIDQKGVRSLRFNRAIRLQLLDHARAAALEAKAKGPVSSQDDKRTGEAPGQYVGKIFAETMKTAEARARFGSRDYKAWWVEFGTPHIKAHHTLVNAAKAVGMRVTEVAR